jgi:hypothetical protein
MKELDLALREYRDVREELDELPEKADWEIRELALDALVHAADNLYAALREAVPA